MQIITPDDIIGNATVTLPGFGSTILLPGTMVSTTGDQSIGGAKTFSSGVRVTGLGVGTAPGTAGSIRATGDITAYFSDDRLKTRIGNIPDALNKISSLSGFYYTPNDVAQSLGYGDKVEVGLSAQEVQNILPEVVSPAPIDDQYLTINYSKLVPLLVEAIKELSAQVEVLKNAN